MMQYFLPTKNIADIGTLRGIGDLAGTLGLSNVMVFTDAIIGGMPFLIKPLRILNPLA